MTMARLNLPKILTSVFNTLYAHVEFRKVKPVDYKLFQAADLYDGVTCGKSRIQLIFEVRAGILLLSTRL